jgi:rRNA maturation endonuclease Nob1
MAEYEYIYVNNVRYWKINCRKCKKDFASGIRPEMNHDKLCGACKKELSIELSRQKAIRIGKARNRKGR